MTVRFVGVRHHSPACARVVQRAIAELRPAHVLVEGPSDVNDRMDEVLLGHDLPIAVFTSYRDDERHHASWTPLCAHSPEWVALAEGRAAGAEVRFIDLPAWHPAFVDRENRYADADLRYHAVVTRLCARLGVDDVDALWDHLFEVVPDDEVAAALVAYFDLIRDEATAASATDTEREREMARWVRAAATDAGDRPVLVVTGGFHRPALVRMEEARAAEAAPEWPEPPAFPAHAVGGSYLVPYSFRRLDAFAGYQSGMPSPAYYHRLWESGPRVAGDAIVTAVVDRLRARDVPVSTANLVAARTQAEGLARLRGHAVPARVDVLDGLLGALVTDALDQRPPWARRGPLRPGTDPVVVEVVAALSGERVGRLHPDTPHPPLVHDVAAERERAGIPDRGAVTVDLATDAGRATSRVLHRLRVLAIPGVERLAGPTAGGRPVLEERWALTSSDLALSALIEAGSYGATLATAAGAALGDRLAAWDDDPRVLAAVLFDAVLAGLDAVADSVLARVGPLIATIDDLGGLGALLATALGLWRHDDLLGAAGSPVLADVVAVATRRALWLVEGIRGGPAPADPSRLAAMVAVRDAARHASAVLDLDVDDLRGVARRCTAPDRPPDLRGAAAGLLVTLGPSAGPVAEDPIDAVSDAVARASLPGVLGDLLAGLFAVAREEVLLADTGILAVLDRLVGGYDDDDFLVALPSLRQAFAWFPPREREVVAERLLAARGLRGSARAFVRGRVDPLLVAEGRALDARVDAIVGREALLSRGRVDG